MEEKERSRSRSPARRASRVQQVVGTIIRRTRESLSRERLLGDGRSQRSNSVSSQNFPVRQTVQVTRDPVLDDSGHGFTLTPYMPLLVREVATGGPADGILYPGDQVLQINDVVVEELTSELVEDVLRDLEDSVSLTILRHMTGPKSSIMSAEKRARLRNNPINVRFAEEVVVNGQTQGNSLLFLPNVLKVYLENGQTKAFKFDNATCVKDIMMTLKDKLSIRCIEYFALVLEQQYSITKLMLLHEDELIQKVVQKKDSHDYRCLFRVCFIPRDPIEMLQDDPNAFEYLFLQSVGDVLQERFAVEMKCNTALRLAALHMHERLDTCGQTRTSIKSITKEFGLDSFISPTLLGNMREKDLRKAISYHLKKIQALLEPRQKVISASQARLAYLTQLAELISYGGRSYSATMMLQDREAPISLLVGARYGMSQVVNPKLNMVSTLVEFSSISRVELLSESDRVSLLRVSLHDMKPFALLMDSPAAKDLACLLGGYCKLLVDPNINVFRLGRPKVRVHRIPAEEGVCGEFAIVEGVCYESLTSYVSRCCSDSDDSSDEDYPAETAQQHSARKRPASAIKDREARRKEEEQRRRAEEKTAREENEGRQEVRIIVTDEEKDRDDGGEEQSRDAAGSGHPIGTTQEGNLSATWYHTDPRVNSSFSSLSSGSLSAALEESSAAAATNPSLLEALRDRAPPLRSPRPAEGLPALDVHHPFLLEVTPASGGTVGASGPSRPLNLGFRGSDNSCLCFAELSQADFLPSPPEATSEEEEREDHEEEEDEDDEGEHELRRIAKIPSQRDLSMIDSLPFLTAPITRPKKLSPMVPQRVSSLPGYNEGQAKVQQRSSRDEESLYLTPSPNPRPPSGVKESASESEDEFFDAQERITPPVPESTDLSAELTDRRLPHRLSGTWNGLPSVPEKGPPSPLARRPAPPENKPGNQETLQAPTKDLSSQPAGSVPPLGKPDKSKPPPVAPKPQLPPKPQVIPPSSPKRTGSYAHCNGDASGRQLLEMEPDTMEFKSVTSGTGGLPLSSALITAVRCSQQPQAKPPQRPEGGIKQENGPKQDNRPKRENGAPPVDALCTTAEKTPPKVEPKANGVSTAKEAAPAGANSADRGRKPPCLPPIPRSNSGEGSKLTLSIPPPVSPKPSSSTFHPLSLPASSPVSPTDPTKGLLKDAATPPNGIHPWGSRNGSVGQSGRRVSLSHESLSPKNVDAPLSLTTSLTSTSSKGVSGETGRSGSGSDLRVSSSSLGGRLPASALRGRIQALPWYMTRSQEILGTLDYPSSSSINGDTSGFGSGLSVVSGASDLSKAPDKEKEPAGPKAAGKGKVLEEGAEVVIATFKEAQEVTSHMQNANGTDGSHSNLCFRGMGSVSSEQPQSRPHSEVGLGGVPSPLPLGGDSPCSSLGDSTPPTTHREACGCRTVYANCFIGEDAEDSCGFDDELTVYEFSRRIRPKPARPTPVPSPTTATANPNILSLLRDTPRPLSTLSTASSELSPLLSRPVSPTAAVGGRLRSLTNKRYGGLKNGFASLRQDIEQLLLVLQRGTADPPSEEPDKTSAGLDKVGDSDSSKLDAGHSDGEVRTAAPALVCNGASPDPLTEAERSLLQAEARRLASGCQRATRVGWAPDEALRSLSNSFSALVQLSAACLRTPHCPGCDVCHDGGLTHKAVDEDSQEALDKLKEIVGLYREFVWAVETAGAGVGTGGKASQGHGEGEGVRLLAKRCTVLISSVFALTQLFRTSSPDPAEPTGHVPLNF